MDEFNVSVIIPVYNAEKYIERAVASAHQISCVKEIILIEDDSQDNSYQICTSLEEKYTKVILLQHPDKKNHGAGPSRNLGIEIANSPYIAFLDADDYFLKERFLITEQKFKQYPTADGIYECLGINFEDVNSEKNWKLRGRNNLTTLELSVKPEDLFSTVLKGKHGYFSIVALTVKKDALTEIRFDDIELSQDTLFILKLISQKRLFPGKIKAPVSIRGVHINNRHSNSKKKLLTYRIEMLNILENWLLEKPKSRSQIRLVVKRRFSEEISYINMYNGGNILKLFSLLKKYLKYPFIIPTKFFLKYILSIIGIMKYIKNTH